MPNGWKLAHIKEVGTVVTGSTPPTKDLDNYGDEYMFVSPADMGGHKYIRSSVKRVSKKGYDKGRKIPPKSTLFTCIGSTIGKIGMNEVELITNQQINSVVPNSDIDPDFLYYSLESVAQRIKKMAGQQAVPLINKSDFEAETITLPENKNEQEKIGKILSVWDEAIERTGSIIKQKELRKKSFERTHFFDQAPSKSISLGNLFERVNKKNNNLESENVLTISAQNGLVNQKDFFKKSVASKNTANYYLLKKGDFAYNKSYSAGYPMGAIKPLEIYEQGIVSPLYICFCLKQHSLVRVGFYKHFFESGAFDLQIASIAQEGARNHGLLNVSVVDFFNLHIPDYSDIQIDGLSAFFDCVDKELLLYRKKLSGLKLQKQGLMQQLITGMKRVKV